MALPILHQRSASSDADLVRFFMETSRRWAEHLADPETLEIGTAFCNPALKGVPQANHVRDVALPENLAVEEAVGRAEAWFAAAGGACGAWVLNPAVAEERTRPVADYLAAKGYRRRDLRVMALPSMPAQALGERQDLQIIPSRASFRHVRELFTIAEQELGMARLPDLVEAHLDDAHLDGLLALKDGQAVAHAAILGAGEISRLDLVYVAPEHRRQGIARTMLSRILEISTRSLYRHILGSVRPEHDSLGALYAWLGMKPVGTVTAYRV